MLRNLLAEMARKKIAKKLIAETIGVNERTLRNKIAGVSPFTYPETVMIRDTHFPGMELEYLFADDKTKEPRNLFNAG